MTTRAVRVLHCIAVCLLVLECGCGSLDLLGNSTCNRTNDEGAVQQLRKEAIQQELLLRLNLDKVPDNPDPETVRRYEEEHREEYQAIRAAVQLRDASSKPCVDVDPRVSRVSVLFPENVEMPGCIHCQQNQSCTARTHDLYNTLRLTFDMDINHLDVTKADLRLFKCVVDKDSGSTLERVDVFFVDPDPENYYKLERKEHVTGQNARTDQEGYVLLDVKSAIDSFKRLNPSLQGEMLLEIQIRTANKPGFSAPPKVQFVTDNTTTQLVITAKVDEFQSEPVVEQKRSIHKRHSDDHEILECSLRRLSIDFRALNWSWVINPDVLELNYCSGVCSRVNTRTKHSEFLSKRNTILRTNPVGAPEPCCVPNEFRSEVLSTVPAPNSNSTGIERLEKITILSCVCR